MSETYLSKKVDLAKALKGSEVEKRLKEAAAAGDVPKDALGRVIDVLSGKAEARGMVTVRDLQDAPSRIGQMPFSGHGADIYLIVEAINEHYKAEVAAAEAATSAKPSKPQTANQA